MELDEIRKELINRGLYTYTDGSKLRAGNYHGEEDGIITMRNIFALRQIGKDIQVDYLEGNRRLENRFEKATALFNFIGENLE